MRWYPAYVGVGSNLDDPATQVQRALVALAGLPQSRLLRRSSLYGSKPMGPAAQPDFVNAVAALLTQLEVRSFLRSCASWNGRSGATPPRERWGPRRIDLDLLLFAQLHLDSAAAAAASSRDSGAQFRSVSSGGGGARTARTGLRRCVAELASRVSPAGIWRLDKRPAALMTRRATVASSASLHRDRGADRRRQDHARHQAGRDPRCRAGTRARR